MGRFLRDGFLSEMKEMRKNMKRIAVITMGVALNGEKGYSRFKFISEFLAENGYEVDLITTTFQHWEKKQRNIQKIMREKYPFMLKFIYEPGYKKNIDFRRIFSHHIASKNIKKYLSKQKEYDLLYLEMPPNDIAKTVLLYGEKKNIPCIVDVNDLWPEAMRMVFDIPIVSDIFFNPFLRDAEMVYSKVSGVIGTSDEYRDRAFKNICRKLPKATIYVGNEIEKFDDGVRKYSGKIYKPDNEFWVTYAGTIGKSYDIKTMIDVSRVLLEEGYENIKMMILGDGPDKEKLEQYSKKICANVEFCGYQIYGMMAAYLAKSDIVVNSFIKKAPQSIVTKIADYLASGKPMINTCNSSEFKEKVKKSGFGINIEAENVDSLKDAILRFYGDRIFLKECGKNARQIAEEQFDRKESYKVILDMISNLI